MDRGDAPTVTRPDTPSERGRCPACGAEIRRVHLLIEYETASGRDAFAECPACSTVVHPDRAD